jgi:hypothetical protein
MVERCGFVMAKNENKEYERPKKKVRVLKGSAIDRCLFVFFYVGNITKSQTTNHKEEDS